MGFDFDRVVGESKELLKCPICLDVVNDPIQVVCCQQVFCRKCMDEWLTQSSSPNVGNCPYDRTRITRRKIKEVPRIVNRLWDTLAIKCQYIRNGCKTLYKLSEIEEHEKRCDYRTGVLISCECGLWITRQDMPHHKCISFLSQKIEFQDKRIVELQTELRKLKHRRSVPTRVVPIIPKRLKKVMKRSSSGGPKRKRPKMTPKRHSRRTRGRPSLRSPTRRTIRPPKRYRSLNRRISSPLRRRFN